jgi:hypothetical protein
MADKAHAVPKLGHARDRPPYVPKADLLVGPGPGPGQKGEDLRCHDMSVTYILEPLLCEPGL